MSQRKGLCFYPKEASLPPSNLPEGVALKTFSKERPEFVGAHSSDIAGRVMSLLWQNQKVSIAQLPHKRKGMLKDLAVDEIEEMLSKRAAFFFLLSEQQCSLGNLYLNRAGEVVDNARKDLLEKGFLMPGGALADVGGFLVQDQSVLTAAGVNRELVIEELFLALQDYVRAYCHTIKYLMVEVAQNNPPMKRVMQQALARSDTAETYVFNDVSSPKFKNQPCQRTILCF